MPVRRIPPSAFAIPISVERVRPSRAFRDSITYSFRSCFSLASHLIRSPRFGIDEAEVLPVSEDHVVEDAGTKKTYIFPAGVASRSGHATARSSATAMPMATSANR
jgi:hypothetical protein